jgi:hypothetical protein
MITTVTEIPDFFSSPDSLRNLALQESYHSWEDFKSFGVEDRGAHWPGYRTYKSLEQVSEPHFQEMVEQLKKIEEFKYASSVEINTQFHITPLSEDFNRWAHKDDQTFTHACIIYLSPFPPSNSGTSILSEYTGEVEVEITNEYNKGVVYSSSALHTPDKFFGTTMGDSRMTIVVFITLTKN